MNIAEPFTALIVGCGWLGLQFSKKCAEKKIRVTGTCRNESRFDEIRSTGAAPLLWDAESDENAGVLMAAAKNADVVLILISPGRGEERKKHPENIRKTLSEIPGEKYVILVSSTSVYGRNSGLTGEEDAIPSAESPNELLRAEAIMQAVFPQGVILRAAGLYGENRHPVTFLAGRTNIPDGDAPVNLISGEALCEAIFRCIERDVKGEIINLCEDAHPSRSVYYTEEAINRGLVPPQFEPGGKESKIVDNKKAGKLGLIE